MRSLPHFLDSKWACDSLNQYRRTKCYSDFWSQARKGQQFWLGGLSEGSHHHLRSHLPWDRHAGQCRSKYCDGPHQMSSGCQIITCCEGESICHPSKPSDYSCIDIMEKNMKTIPRKISSWQPHQMQEIKPIHASHQSSDDRSPKWHYRENIRHPKQMLLTQTLSKCLPMKVWANKCWVLNQCTF